MRVISSLYCAFYRVAALATIPIVLVGCGTDTSTPQPQAPESSSSESIAEVEQPEAGPCSDIKIEPMREIFPELKTVPRDDSLEGEPATVCNFDYEDEYIKETVTDRGAGTSNFFHYGARVEYMHNPSEEIYPDQSGFITSPSGRKVLVSEGLTTVGYSQITYLWKTDDERTAALHITALDSELPSNNVLNQVSLETIDDLAMQV